MTDPIAQKLEAFVCQRCQECCRQPGYVYLTKGEEERMAHFLKLSVFDFVNQYCQLQDRRELVLDKGKDEACVFLTEEGCSIHEVKPAQCLDFPSKWRTPRSFEYCVGLKKLN